MRRRMARLLRTHPTVDWQDSALYPGQCEGLSKALRGSGSGGHVRSQDSLLPGADRARHVSSTRRICHSCAQCLSVGKYLGQCGLSICSAQGSPEVHDARVRTSSSACESQLRIRNSTCSTTAQESMHRTRHPVFFTARAVDLPQVSSPTRSGTARGNGRSSNDTGQQPLHGRPS